MFKIITNFVLMSCIILAAFSLTFSNVNHQRILSHMMTIHNSANLYEQHLANVDTQAFIAKTLKTIQAINASIDLTKQTVMLTAGVQNFAYGPQTCQALKAQDKTMLAGNASDVKTRLKNLSGKTKNETTKADAQNQAFYLQTIEKLLNQDCGTTLINIVGPTPMQTNINSQQPWILGSVSLTNLVQSYVDRYQKNNNVSTCDVKTPFFDGLKCIKCDSPTPIFNISSSKCTACPAGFIYDAQIKQCIPGDKPSKPNVAAATPNILISSPLGPKDVENYLAGSGIQCPLDKPFINGTQCVQCSAPTPLFDLKTKKCSSCPNGIDTATHTCKPSSNVTYQPNSAGKDQIVLTPPQNATDLQNYLNTPGTPCPVDKPFATSTGCIACTAPNNLFNLTSKTCTSCLNGYDVTTHTCKPSSNVTSNVTYQPNSAGKDQIVLTPPQNATDLQNYLNTPGTPCPVDKPFATSTGCIACTAPNNLFNLTSKTCTSCPNGYDVTTHTCKPSSNVTSNVTYQPNSAGKDQIVLTPPQNATDLQNYLNTPGTPCPVDKPFATSTGCIACTAPNNLFNLTSKTCTSCLNGYDVTTHTCKPSSNVTSNVTYQPNSAGKDQIVLTPPQNATDLQNYLNTPGTPCPVDKPFATSTGCIACTAPNNLFNLTSKTCTSCPNGYDVTTHTCKPSNVTAPSVPFTDSKPRVILSGNLTKTDLDNYYASNGVQCPSDKPFFDGKVCIQCAAPTPFFDLGTKKCVSCDSPYTFNQDTQKCQKAGATDVAANVQKLMMNPDSADTVWTNYETQNANKVVCPSTKPYWNKTECISCPDNFNIVSYKCDVCPQAQSLDTSTHKCADAQPLSPNLLDLFNSIG